MNKITFQTKYGRTYYGYQDGEDSKGDPLYRIPDVPIFSECEDSRCHPPNAYGKEWLEEAVENLNVLEKKGHFKPVHFGHHKGAENLEDVGKQTGHNVDFLDGYGWTIFCDLVQVPAHIFEKLKDGRISFRSVEIPSPTFNKPIISSLALLSSQDPFHEYPNMVVEEVPAPAGASFQTVMFCKHGNRDYVLFPYDQEIPMPKTKDPKKEKFMAPAAPAAPAVPAAPAAPAAPAPMDPNQLMQLVQQLQQQMQALQTKVDQMAQGGKETQEPPAASAEPGKMQKGESSMSFQLAKLAADNVQLKSYLKQHATEKEVDRFVETVEKQGSILDTDSLRETARTFAKMGPEALEAFANHVLANNIPPATNLPKAENFDTHDPVLEEYEDPEIRAYAKQALEMWHNSQNKMNFFGKRSGLTKSDFVYGQVRARFPRFQRKAQ